MRKCFFFRFTICLGLLLTSLAYPSQVSACSCLEIPTFSQQFEEHDAVFSGRVSRIVDNYYPVFSTIDSILYKLGFQPYFFDTYALSDSRKYGFSVFFRVDNSWKGVETNFTEVHTGRGGGDCGYSFAAGKEYLVYANYAYGVSGNYWVTSICGRNAEISDAREDFEYLAEIPMVPLKHTLPFMVTEEDFIVFGLPLLMAIGVIASVRKRAKRKGETS